MAIIKGVAKYALILVLLVLGLALVLGAVMVLFNVPIFGFRFANVSAEYDYTMKVSTENTDTSIMDFDKILIEADRFAVQVVYTPLDNVIIDGEVRLNGFFRETDDTKGEKDLNKFFKIEKPQTIIQGQEEKGTLLIRTLLQDGMINTVSTKVTIAIPKSHKNLVSIVVSTGAGMFTMTDRVDSEDGEDQLTVQNLKVTTTSGSQNIDSCGIANFESVSERGDVNIGNMKTEESDTTTVTGNVKITNKYGKITFKDGINIGGNCDIESVTSVIKMNNVYGSFSYKGDSGYITLKDVTGTVYLDSSDVDCKINSINESSAELVLSNGKGASLDIESINAATVVVKTQHGNIDIDSLKTDTANFDTTTGNITIGKLSSQIKATTTTGNITIEQDDLVNCILNDSGTLPIDVSTQKGTVVLTNINAKLNAVVSENGTIEVEMVGVFDDCVISGGTNFVNVELPTIRFDTITSSKSGSVDFNLLEHIYTGNGYTFSRINNAEPDNFNTVTERDAAIQADRDAGIKFVTISSESGNITVKAYIPA